MPPPPSPPSPSPARAAASGGVTVNPSPGGGVGGVPTVASRDGSGPVLTTGGVSEVTSVVVAGASVVTVTVYTDGGSLDMSVDSMSKIVVNSVWSVTVGGVPAAPEGVVPERPVDDIRDVYEVRSVEVTVVGRPD